MTLKGLIRIAAGLTGIALGFQAPLALAEPREAGVWYDDTGKGAVKIEACGEKLCGRIHWLKEPLNAEGKPLRDKHNPNTSQQNRPICGLQVIGGLARMQDGEWDTGWIYDPKEGKSYSVALAMTDPNTLKVTGYLVMKMMGRTLTWKRAPGDLPSCAANAASAPAPGGAVTKAAAPAPKAASAPSRVAAPLPPEEAEVPPAAAPNAPAGDTVATPPAAKPRKPAPVANPAKVKDDVKPSAAKAAGAPPVATKTTVQSGSAKAPTNASAKKTPGGATDKAASTGPTNTAKAEQLPWTSSKAATANAATQEQPALSQAAASTPAPRPARPKLPDEQARPFQ